MSNSTEKNQGKNMSQEQNCKYLKSPVPRKQKQETSNYKRYFPQIPRSKMEGRPGNLIPLRKISQKSLKEDIWQCNLCRRYSDTFSGSSQDCKRQYLFQEYY